MTTTIPKTLGAGKSTPPASYGTSPIRRSRRSKADLRALRAWLLTIIAEIRPATVRQVFYQATVRGLIEKTEAGYKLICRELTFMRRNGLLPFDWIADNTRWQRKPRTYASLEAMLRFTKQTYRRALWNDQDVYVEVWLEKEALAGVLIEITRQYDVPLMVTKGYPSLSFLHSAAAQIAAQRKPAYLYYFGDRDPSGVDIDRFVKQELRKYAPRSEIHFSRVAVLLYQIEQLNLPTRPTKRTDSRAGKFNGQSVEVDAIHPATLREMCEDCILGHVDDEALAATQRVEEAERGTLDKIIANLEAAE